MRKHDAFLLEVSDNIRKILCKVRDLVRRKRATAASSVASESRRGGVDKRGEDRHIV